MNMIVTQRLILRRFRASDYDDLYEFLLQLKDDEFEGYPGITCENAAEHLKHRMESEEFYAVELKATGKVIGNIYCGSREYSAREVGVYHQQGLSEKRICLRSAECGHRRSFPQRRAPGLRGV